MLRELSKKEKIYVNGIDVSENMIHIAKMRYPYMSFEVKPCYPLEWSDESIDIITVCCAFHHFDNPQGFVNECKRGLKKKGTVYIADPNFGAMLRFFTNKFWVPFSKLKNLRCKTLSLFCNQAVERIKYYED